MEESTLMEKMNSTNIDEDDQTSEITMISFDDDIFGSEQEINHVDGQSSEITIISFDNVGPESDIAQEIQHEDSENSEVTMISFTDAEFESDAEAKYMTDSMKEGDGSEFFQNQIDEFDNKNYEHFQSIGFSDDFAESDNGRSLTRNYENAKQPTRRMSFEFKSVVLKTEDDEKIVVLKEMLKQKDEQFVTKKGQPRQRKSFTYSSKEREVIKAQLKDLQRGVKPACLHGNCRSAISVKRRQDINFQFWRLDFPARSAFVHSTISRDSIKSRNKNSKALRTNTFTYYLKNESGKLVNVCKQFYLSTLGYKPANDSFIRKLLGKKNYRKPLPARSEQGKHQKTPKKDRTIIEGHINSFNPSISHHRRVHSPKKKYLPSDLTIILMHADFNQKHPGLCSYDLYRKILSDDLNISFAHLGHEECEVCEEFQMHSDRNATSDSHTIEKLDMNCSECKIMALHRDRYTQGRMVYNSHKTLSTADHYYVSGDLQKVMMLPRIDTFKRVIFLPRLIAFNESFVPIGEGTNIKPLAVLWHEAIAGRKKEEIISTFYKYLLENKTVKKHTIWLDNCSAQNKNWALLAFLIHVINSNEIEAKSIEFYYFEPGHTFMSADYFHHQVEEALKRMKKVYNFDDFKEAVLSSNSENVNTVEMEYSDFFEWTNPYSYTKVKNMIPRPYLADIVYIRADRGSMILKYKTSYSSSAEEFPLDFLQVKCLKEGIPLPPTKSGNRGVLKDRKDKIVSKLGSLMPNDKLLFWKNLPETQKESKLSDD